MVLPPVLFAGLAAMFLWGMGRDDPEGVPSAMIGREVPAVSQTTLPEKTQLTDAMLRQPGVKLVNFWGSWCPPCRAEHPTLMELSARVPIYGINSGDTDANALSFLAEDGDPFTAIATDPRRRTGVDWGVTAYPETFIIDGDGKVLYRFAGPLIRDDYTDRFLPELEKALSEEQPEG